MQTNHILEVTFPRVNDEPSAKVEARKDVRNEIEQAEDVHYGADDLPNISPLSSLIADLLHGFALFTPTIQR